MHKGKGAGNNYVNIQYNMQKGVDTWEFSLT